MLILRTNSTAELIVDRNDLSNLVPLLAQLETQLRDECAQVVIVNLQAFDSIFSLQIGALAAMHVMCYENLAVMKLSHVHDHVKNQLTMVGLDKMMEIHHGAKAASESFRA